MAGEEPDTQLDARYSSEGATALEWPEARRVLEDAQLYWLSTVRPDGRPHVTPLLSVWLDDALYFCTGPSEKRETWRGTGSASSRPGAMPSTRGSTS